MTVTATDLTDTEIEDFIKAALVSELNVHPSDVEVSYDSDSGVATYTVSSDDAESLVEIVADMNQDAFTVNADGVSVDSLTPPTEVTAVVDVSVDAANVENVEDAISSATTAIETQDSDYDVTGDGTSFFKLCAAKSDKNHIYIFYKTSPF